MTKSKYGNTIKFSRWGVMLVLNGYMFSVFIGSNDKKLHATFNKNIWRKTKTRCGEYPVFNRDLWEFEYLRKEQGNG